MKKLLFIVCAYIISFSFVGCNNKKEISVIPKPNKLIIQSGKYTLSNPVKIFISSDELNNIGEYVSKIIKTATGFDVTVEKADATNDKGIYLLLENSSSQDEGYTLVSSNDNVVITAKKGSGIFYGIQTMLQLLPVEIYGNVKVEKEWTLPCVNIEDYPRFGWRGVHLDVSRHFYSVDFIKNFLDILAIHKINIMHWHLVDDQGWRIEIKKYPKLTEIGAWRVDDGLPFHYDYQITNDPSKKLYGGFYTQEQIKDIVKYANDRYITIIPEIEMPGHSMAVSFAYPEIFCSGKPYKKPENVAFEFTDPFCVGNEKTFEFLENVLNEVMELFPSKYIHVGGDECKKIPWEKCSKCKARMRNEKLSTVEELQSYMIKRMEKYIVSKGRKLIGWDEILEGGLAPEATVMSWRGEAGGIEAAKQSHDVIMVPSNVLYLDSYQFDQSLEDQTQSMVNTMPRIYDYNPVPKELSDEQSKHIIGVQACIWTEYMYTSNDVLNKLLPRVSAVSEIAWTSIVNKSFDNFLIRMQDQFSRYAALNIDFFVEPPSGLQKENVYMDKAIVNLHNTYPFAQIRYTIDGTDPNESSTLFEKPFVIDQNLTLKVRSVFPGGRMSKVISGTYEKQLPSDAITLAKEPLPGLIYHYYEGEIITLKDFSKLKDISNATISTINLSPAKIKDHFGLMYDGYIKIPVDSVYTLILSSDDGSALTIDDKLLIDYDGVHGAGEMQKQIALKAGYHKINVQYFEALYGEVLKVSIIGPGLSKQEIPMSMLFH